MTNTVKTVHTVALAVMTLSLLGCGGGARLKPGKEPAAQAVYNASQSGNASQSSGLMEALYNPRALPSANVTVNCRSGGTVTLANIMNEVVLGTGVSAQQRFDMNYSHCSHDGKTTYDGQLVTEKKVMVEQTGVYALLTLKGQLTLSGDVSDTLNVDIVEEVSVAQLGASSGAVNLTLTGNITTASGRYDYVSESISVTAGASLEADIQTGG